MSWIAKSLEAGDENEGCSADPINILYKKLRETGMVCASPNWVSVGALNQG